MASEKFSIEMQMFVASSSIVRHVTFRLYNNESSRQQVHILYIHIFNVISIRRNVFKLNEHFLFDIQMKLTSQRLSSFHLHLRYNVRWLLMIWIEILLALCVCYIYVRIMLSTIMQSWNHMKSAV